MHEIKRFMLRKEVVKLKATPLTSCWLILDPVLFLSSHPKMYHVVMVFEDLLTGMILLSDNLTRVRFLILM